MMHTRTHPRTRTHTHTHTHVQKLNIKYQLNRTASAFKCHFEDQPDENVEPVTIFFKISFDALNGGGDCKVSISRQQGACLPVLLVVLLLPPVTTAWRTVRLMHIRSIAHALLHTPQAP